MNARQACLRDCLSSSVAFYCLKTTRWCGADWCHELAFQLRSIKPYGTLKRLLKL